MKHPEPLPVEAGISVYVEPGDNRRFYHLSTGCPCFKYNKGAALLVIDAEQIRLRELHPCFFCAYEPPPPLTRKERAVAILTAPLCLLHLPSGMVSAAFTCVAFVAALRMYYHAFSPLWATILVGVAIVGLGLWLDIRYGYIE
jgi:hypothetical protein